MSAKQDSAGFNLLDLLIVLALLVMVATAGFERLDGLTERTRLAGAAKTLHSELNRARGLAVSHNLTVRFELRSPPLEYGFGPVGANWDWKPLGPGLELSRIPRRPVQFHSRGTASPAGTFEISNSAGRARIIVNVAGRVRIEEDYAG